MVLALATDEEYPMGSRSTEVAFALGLDACANFKGKRFLNVQNVQNAHVKSNLENTMLRAIQIRNTVKTHIMHSHPRLPRAVGADKQRFAIQMQKYFYTLRSSIRGA